MNKKQCQIIFVALTTYQLMISEIYAHYISKQNKEICVVAVGLKPLFHTEKSVRLYVIPDLNDNRTHRLWQRLYFGGLLFSLSRLNVLLKEYDESLIFIFNDNEPITNKLVREVKKKGNSKCVIIEEGIGIYSETKDRKLSYKEKLRYCFTRLLGSPMQYKAIGDNELIDYAIVGNPKLYQSLRKSQRQTVLLQSKEKLYADGFSIIKKDYLSDENIQPFDILYLGQPFSDFCDLTENEEAYLDWLLGCVCKDYKVVIKPHPRDAKGKYEPLLNKWHNVELFDSRLASLPIECIVGGTEMKAVISHKSSAGINIANLMKNICCIFTYKCGISPSSNRGGMQHIRITSLKA